MAQITIPLANKFYLAVIENKDANFDVQIRHYEVAHFVAGDWLDPEDDFGVIYADSLGGFEISYNVLSTALASVITKAHRVALHPARHFPAGVIKRLGLPRTDMSALDAVVEATEKLAEDVQKIEAQLESAVAVS